MANNIIRARIEIQGTRPLLQHAFGEYAMPLEKGERTGVPGNDPEEWKQRSMITKDGTLYVRGSNLFSMIRDAAKHTKKGRGSIQFLVAATLQVEEATVLLNRRMPEGTWPLEPVGQCSLSRDPTDPVYLDVCGVKNPSTKARNVRYRLAISPGWKIAFHILWDKTIVSRQQMEAVLNDAGMLVGLGDGRGIGSGRFVVSSFEVLDAAKATAA